MRPTTAAVSAPPPIVHTWAPTTPVISPELVLRLQKYRNPATAPAEIRDAARSAADEAMRLVAPRIAAWRGPVTELGDDGQVTLAQVHRFRSRLLARLLASSTAAYVIVLTLGDALEQRVDELFEAHDPFEGWLLETAGWAAIVTLARDLRRALRAREREAGRSVTHRVAPGYGDWPVDDQSALLAVFGDTPVPVTVTASSVMLPRKSISAVFGVVAA